MKSKILVMVIVNLILCISIFGIGTFYLYSLDPNTSPWYNYSNAILTLLVGAMNLIIGVVLLMGALKDEK